MAFVLALALAGAVHAVHLEPLRAADADGRVARDVHASLHRTLKAEGIALVDGNDPPAFRVRRLRRGPDPCSEGEE